MAEVLAAYSDTIVGPDGGAYRAQACGAPAAGLWEGWIEFQAPDGTPPIRSPRETTQPNHADLVYWASGLTTVYLEGALNRALSPHVKEPPPTLEAYFDGPAPDVSVVPPRPVSAVLNPFSVYEKGESLLEQELGALSARHL